MLIWLNEILLNLLQDSAHKINSFTVIVPGDQLQRSRESLRKRVAMERSAWFFAPNAI